MRASYPEEDFTNVTITDKVNDDNTTTGDASRVLPRVSAITIGACTLAVYGYSEAVATLKEEKHSSTKGHIRGPAVMGRKQPRNSLCVCGSGKKAKRCCVHFK